MDSSLWLGVPVSQIVRIRQARRQHPHRSRQNTAGRCARLQHTAAHCCNTHTAAHLQGVWSRYVRLEAWDWRNVRLTATHYIALQHTTSHCSILPRTATHYIALQHTTSHCNILPRTARHYTSHCNTLHHAATHSLQCTIYRAVCYVYVRCANTRGRRPSIQCLQYAIWLHSLCITLSYLTQSKILYDAASVIRIDQIIGLFCERALLKWDCILQKRPLVERIDRSHPIVCVLTHETLWRSPIRVWCAATLCNASVISLRWNADGVQC